MRLKNKLAVITAAASGMGAAGCEVFAREGATVFAIDINKKNLDEVVARVGRAGGKAYGMVADLLDPDNCRKAIAEAAAQMGGIDILWNHAGIPGLRDVEDLDLDGYAKTMDLNIRTGLVMSGAAIAHMRKRGGGAIVFTASTAGLVGASVSPVYSAAKFGVVGMGKSLALRYAEEKIRVNVVCPGPIETPMFPDFFDPNASKEVALAAQAKVVAAIPLARMGQAIEVANAALWLASDEASFVTGAALPVDGGFTAR
ncbi:MAG: 2,5-dichloro-2,5-cyclohexadiene,4-diol dehydrogenase [Variovorax sp.]|nr:2,5-dichloro-2,5-cyclohexadiene,4-diol dehydrogenase [Variovorax sp.]